MARGYTQNDKILKHLRTHKRGITQAQAYERYGCLRLASRISDLRRMGYAINREMIAVRNRDGETAYVAQYTLQER